MKQQKIIEQYNQQITIIVIVGLLFLLRFLLSNRLPIFIIGNSPHDDGWIVRRAVYFLHGQWMGPYDQYTLIKGVFSPLLLAFSIGIGATFQGLNTMLYCSACLNFTIAVRPILKRRWTQLFCLVILLFNPITYALQTGQRIYRNGISQWQLLLIFGSLIALFLRRKNSVRSLVKWALLGGIALGTFFQTREDGLFIYPFVIAAIAATIFACLLEKKLSWKRTMLIVLPLILAIAINGTVAVINYAYYGAAVSNDRDGGNYAKVMQDLYFIKPNAKEEALYQSEKYKTLYYNIYASTVKKAFLASPTFKSAAQPIQSAIAMWDNWDELKDGEPFADHILFAIRDGVQGAGHYKSLPETEAFYGLVHKELEMAFENGSLEKRGISFSAMAAPLKEGDLAKTFSILPHMLKNIVRFDGVSSELVPASGPTKNIEAFRLLAGGDYYTASAPILTGNGWAFSYDKNIQLTASLCDTGGNVLRNVPFISGKDVFDYFTSIGKDCNNARKCRFYFALEGHDLSSGVKLRFNNIDGQLYREIPLDGSTHGGSDSEFHYAIDSLFAENRTSLPIEFYAHFTGRANRVIGIYQALGLLIGVLAGLSYLWTTISLFLELSRKKELNTLPVWLFLTGLALSLLLFLLCMCFMTATTFNTNFYLYLSPAYALYLMFCGTALCWAVNDLLDRKERKFIAVGGNQHE